MTAPAPLSGGDARTQPTDDERETAIDALGYRGRTYGEIPGSFVYHVDAIAQALADQRTRYRTAIESSWDDQCAGNRNEDACESCRAYTDAIRAVEWASDTEESA